MSHIPLYFQSKDNKSYINVDKMYGRKDTLGESD